jgi:hypothetical protein
VSIEAEDFDFGGPTVSYHETDDYYINNYRDDSVDIKENNGYTVLMESNEWLEYTVYVDSSAYFNIDIYGRTDLDESQITVHLNGNTFKDFDINYTNDSTLFVSNKLYNIALDSGTHVLRLNASKKVEIDYIEISTPDENTSPYVQSALEDQLLFADFVDFTIDLGIIFEDLETLDKDLTYSVTGGTNVMISLEGEIASIASTEAWEGSEQIVFTAKDFSGAIVSDTILFTVSESFARANESYYSTNKGYIFTFDQSKTSQCSGTMIPHVSTANTRNGYEIESVGGGHLVINSNGDQFGTDNIALGFNNTCDSVVIDLSHPDQRVIEIRIHSTVNVSEFLALVTDHNGISADIEIESYELTAGNWHTLTFEFNDLKSWSGGDMDVTQLRTVNLYFRNNNAATRQTIAGTFTIDYIKLGNEVISCQPIYVAPELEVVVESDSTIVNVIGYGQNLSYQWYKDNVALSNSSNYNGSNSNSLVINDFTAFDNGNYHCVLSDTCGASNDTSQVTEIIAGAYYGTFTPIPARIEAEDYQDMIGAEIRTASDTGNTTKLGGWHTGAYAEYEIYVPDSGFYKLELRVATATTVAEYGLLVDGVEVSRTFMPNTGGWEVWKNVEHQLELEPGEHTFRIYIHHGWFGLNWLKFSPADPAGLNHLDMVHLEIFPNPVHDNIHFRNNPQGIVSVMDTEGRIIKTNSVNEGQSIDVSSLPKGIYQIILEDNSGIKYFTRFVKE